MAIDGYIINTDCQHFPQSGVCQAAGAGTGIWCRQS
jgi:hypothetical protein